MFAKTFHNTLFASSLLVGASLLAGPAAMAQVVSGTVQEASSVTFSPETGITTNIIVGEENLTYPLGTLTVQNNAPTGWTLEVSSLNGGKLINPDAPVNDVIAYTALTTGALGASNATSVTFAAAATDYPLHDSVYDAAVAAEVSGVSVAAQIAAGQFVPAGVYSDTLTFTLTSKPEI